MSRTVEDLVRLPTERADLGDWDWGAERFDAALIDLVARKR